MQLIYPHPHATPRLVMTMTLKGLESLSEQLDLEYMYLDVGCFKMETHQLCQKYCLQRDTYAYLVTNLR